MFLKRILQTTEQIRRKSSVLISILSQAVRHIACRKFHYHHHSKYFHIPCNIHKRVNFSPNMIQKFQTPFVTWLGLTFCDAFSSKFKHEKFQQHWITPARFASNVTWFSIISYGRQSAHSSTGHFKIRYSVIIENKLQLLNPEDEGTTFLRNIRNYLPVIMP